jgi:hypothetical protein
MPRSRRPLPLVPLSVYDQRPVSGLGISTPTLEQSMGGPRRPEC